MEIFRRVFIATLEYAKKVLECQPASVFRRYLKFWQWLRRRLRCISSLPRFRDLEIGFPYGSIRTARARMGKTSRPFRESSDIGLYCRVSHTDTGRPPFRRILRNGLQKNPLVLWTQSLPDFVYNPAFRPLRDMKRRGVSALKKAPQSSRRREFPGCPSHVHESSSGDTVFLIVSGREKSPARSTECVQGTGTATRGSHTGNLHREVSRTANNRRQRIAQRAKAACARCLCTCRFLR